MSSYKDGTKLISRVHPTTPDDEIVIAGMAGSFPNSHDIDEYKHNLYNKVSFKGNYRNTTRYIKLRRL